MIIEDDTESVRRIRKGPERSDDGTPFPSGPDRFSTFLFLRAAQRNEPAVGSRPEDGTVGRVTDPFLKTFRESENFPEIDPCFDPHLMKHVKDILRRNVPGCPGGERTPAESRE